MTDNPQPEHVAFGDAACRSVRAFGMLAGALGTAVLLTGTFALGAPGALDQMILLSFRVPGQPDDPLGSIEVESFMRDVTALGGFGILILFVCSVAIYLRLKNEPRHAFALVAIAASGWFASHVLKWLIGRARPDIVAQHAEHWNASLPSGHAMSSAVIYLTVAMMLVDNEPSRAVRAFVLGAAISIVVLVGVSRVYLGVHWPTDVLFGWCFGALWAAMGWIAFARSMDREGRLGVVRS